MEQHAFAGQRDAVEFQHVTGPAVGKAGPGQAGTFAVGVAGEIIAFDALGVLRGIRAHGLFRGEQGDGEEQARHQQHAAETAQADAARERGRHLVGLGRFAHDHQHRHEHRQRRHLKHHPGQVGKVILPNHPPRDVHPHDLAAAVREQVDQHENRHERHQRAEQGGYQPPSQVLVDGGQSHIRSTRHNATHPAASRTRLGTMPRRITVSRPRRDCGSNRMLNGK